MRKTYEPSPEMQADYDRAHADYLQRLDAYNQLSFWKKLTTRKPKWNAIAPGYYLITVWRYFDRDVDDAAWGNWGTWALGKREYVRVNDYSPQWYSREEALAEQRARQAAQRDSELASAIWRANVGNAYYDNNQPWAWQRDPGRYS